LCVPAVQIEGLVKRLRGGVTAVDGLDLRVDEGHVVALLGPNGAGKSVTLRVLLGLVRPTAGRVRIFGEPVRPGARVLGRVGALVDGPGFVPHLSGLDNLRLAERLTHRSEEGTGLEGALKIAGLGEASRRPYSTYSHGMRYRLGLAQALLGHPDLLLLDEPVTGLDPAHVREVRDAIAAVAVAGRTVLLSSHHLTEIEHICTHAAVMQKGRLVASGSVADLVGSTRSVYLEVDDRARAANELRRLPEAGRVIPDEIGVRVEGDQLRPMALFEALDAAGVRVRAFHQGRTLEEAYLELFQHQAASARERRPEPP
jgi:ABC-2 type transport system ATP-binding protein